MHVVTDDDRFLFDLQGFLVLRGAIELDLVEALDRAVVENEAIEHDESWAEGLPVVTHGHLTKDRYIDRQVRLNGLPRLDPVFDRLIAHPGYLPFLREFMAEPQLVNTWSISKYAGRNATGWHSGIQPADYTVRGGKMIFTEALVHAGAAKTSTRRRTTLQYNHVERTRAGSGMADYHNARHYWMPPSIRSRFTPEQRALTSWMSYTVYACGSSATRPA